MANKTVVVHSFNLDEAHCVDIFRREDGSFGFEEYRREAEDDRGWFPVGCYSELSFPTSAQALEAAKTEVRWLTGAIAG